MNSQQLLYFNLLILLALVLYFVLGRAKPQTPTRLDLKSGAKEPEATQVAEKVERHRIVEAKDVTPFVTPEKISTPLKPISIFFIYNGHEWESHEVLGLPKGCSLQTATSHYQNLIKTSDPSTFEFFEAAYSAILKAKQNK